jgi:hypothetical protein
VIFNSIHSKKKGTDIVETGGWPGISGPKKNGAT